MASTVRSRSSAAMTERHARAMGTRVHVLVAGGDHRCLAEVACGRIRRLESLWSRFIDTSDVTRMNRSAGSWVAVDPASCLLVERAMQARELTAGRFDPTLADRMRRLGYDRSFDDLEPGGVLAEDLPPLDEPAFEATRPATPPVVEVDDSLGAVCVATGTAFDAGGIGKGLAAELVSNDVMCGGATGALVNIGGDLFVRGRSPDGGPWRIEITEPAWHAAPITTIELDHGSVATSTSLRRRWAGPSDQERHHIIDPATGRSTRENDSDAVLATTIASTGWWAEAAATASIGSAGSPLPEVHVLRILADGTEQRSAQFGAFER